MYYFVSFIRYFPIFSKLPIGTLFVAIFV